MFTKLKTKNLYTKAGVIHEIYIENSSNIQKIAEVNILSKEVKYFNDAAKTSFEVFDTIVGLFQSKSNKADVLLYKYIIDNNIEKISDLFTKEHLISYQGRENKISRIKQMTSFTNITWEQAEKEVEKYFLSFSNEALFETIHPKYMPYLKIEKANELNLFSSTYDDEIKEFLQEFAENYLSLL